MDDAVVAQPTPMDIMQGQLNALGLAYENMSQQVSSMAQLLQEITKHLPPPPVSPPSPHAPAAPTPAAPTVTTPTLATGSGFASSSSARCPKPAEYNGNQKELKSWLSRTTDILRYSGFDLDRSDCIKYVCTFLTGTARTLWDAEVALHPDDTLAGLRNWDDFKALLTRFVEDPFPDRRARSKLRELKQTGSVKDYTDKFLRLSAHLPNRDEADKLDDYVTGLKPTIRQYVLLSGASTLEQARIKAHEIDMDPAVVAAARASSSFSRQYNNNPRHSSSSATPMELGTVSTSARRGRSPSRHFRSPSASPARSRSTGRSASTSSSAHAPRYVPLNQLSADERAELISKKACFYCRQPNAGHRVDNCPVKARRQKMVTFAKGTKN